MIWIKHKQIVFTKSRKMIRNILGPIKRVFVAKVDKWARF